MSRIKWPSFEIEPEPPTTPSLGPLKACDCHSKNHRDGRATLYLCALHWPEWEARFAARRAVGRRAVPALSDAEVMEIRNTVAPQLDDLCAYARCREVLGASEEGEAELRLIRAIASALHAPETPT